ncbi:MARVEL domain-containing protein 1 [Pseudophryne corroboree]|uniref:MARVEL domain-containing protein 1 n=1 Tax=Pseudophryne corroboree TaxID=495146 RepID=UPI003081D9EC
MSAQVTRSSLSANKDFLRSFPGVLRVLQLVSGAALWITIASNTYSGAVHFALFVAVFFWLLTLILYFLTLLDKQELVPVLGGDRWLLTNLVYDALAAALHIAATVIMGIRTEELSFCNLDTYRLPCLFKTYMVASIFAALCCLFYLLTAVCFSYKRCKGKSSVI